MSPTLQQLLVSGLQLRLNLAEAALVRGDQVIYSDQLNAVGAAIDEHYLQGAVEIEAMVDDLTALAAQPVAQPLPDLSGSLRALRALRGGRPAAVTGSRQRR